MPLDPEQRSRAIEILKALGKSYLSRGQYREATAKYEHLLRLGIREPEVYRDLAVALAGQKRYTPEAQRLYGWALEKFPDDKILCLHLAEAMLHHGAEDEHAQRCYEAALAYHPPFTKELYLKLHHIFHRGGQFDNSFQTLKQALYLEKSGDDELLTRLTDLGWHYDRLDELIMTLRFLLGNNETNPTIRRCLAFSFAHAIILQHRKEAQARDLVVPRDIALPLIREFLPAPSALTTLQAIREYCTLRLALLFSERAEKKMPRAEAKARPNENTASVSASGFEYRFLLDEFALEEVLANPALPPLPPLSGSQPATAQFHWQRDFLDRLPCYQASESPIHAVLALAIYNIEKAPSQRKAKLPHALSQKFLVLAAQHLAETRREIRIHLLNDGLLAFAPDAKVLATAAIGLFQKVARYNTSAPENNQIVLRVALHTVDQSQLRFNSSGKEDQRESNLTAMEVLYHALYLAQAEVNTTKPRQSCLLMHRNKFDSAFPAQFFAAEFLGKIYLGAPSLREEICEVIWYNPLDYATEKQPYALGRFLVIEKFTEARGSYGTYRARDRFLERTVVLKALPPKIYTRLRQNEEQHAELINAIRHIGRLEHPGVPLIYDLGAHDDIFFFAREYIEGQTLASRLSTNAQLNGNPTLSPLESLRLIIAVCRILQYAHQHEVYHGNLKPTNIWILTPSNFSDSASVHRMGGGERSENDIDNSRAHFATEVKVSDFFIPGFNRSEITKDRLLPDPSIKDQGKTFGMSWHYMAPEQLTEKTNVPPLNHASSWQATVDVYALGMILYECFCGEHPYTQVDTPSTLRPWDKLVVIPPSIVNKNLPPICDDVILQAIHTDPPQRFQTIKEFEAALRRVLGELEKVPIPVKAEQPSTIDETI